MAYQDCNVIWAIFSFILGSVVGPKWTTPDPDPVYQVVPDAKPTVYIRPTEANFNYA
jgi:hypothetical protein